MENTFLVALYDPLRRIIISKPGKILLYIYIIKKNAMNRKM